MLLCDLCDSAVQIASPLVRALLDVSQASVAGVAMKARTSPNSDVRFQLNASPDVTHALSNPGCRSSRDLLAVRLSAGGSPVENGSAA